MNRSASWTYPGIFYLTVSLVYGSVLLRSLVTYQKNPLLGQILILLFMWLVLFITSETTISHKWQRAFSIYLVLQTILVFILIFRPGSHDFDFYAVLYAILSMQIMQRFDIKAGVAWISLFAILMIFSLTQVYGIQGGVAFALVYSAINIFLAFYVLATRRAQTAHAQNQRLAQELEEANLQLQTYSANLEQLAAARERNRLARELHDSVTQTIFSMNLSAQSAVLLLERDPSRVGSQLERLNQLAQGALAEMQILISELRPRKLLEAGLVNALRQHITDKYTPERMSISFDVKGEGSLEQLEEQNLFRIAQESLNNIEKHAQTSEVHIRLHLTEPFWMEIEDQGRGFNPNQIQDSNRVGLLGMHERANEIGWDLLVTSSPGTGTCVRVEKKVKEKNK